MRGTEDDDDDDDDEDEDNAGIAVFFLSFFLSQKLTIVATLVDLFRGVHSDLNRITAKVVCLYACMLVLFG